MNEAQEVTLMFNVAGPRESKAVGSQNSTELQFLKIQIRYYWGVMFYKTTENNAYQINFLVKNIIEKYGKNYFKEAL